MKMYDVKKYSSRFQSGIILELHIVYLILSPSSIEACFNLSHALDILL